MKLARTKGSASTPTPARIKNSLIQDATTHKIAKLLKEFPHASMSLVSMLVTAKTKFTPVAMQVTVLNVQLMKSALLLAFHGGDVTLLRLTIIMVVIMVHALLLSSVTHGRIALHNSAFMKKTKKIQNIVMATATLALFQIKPISCYVRIQPTLPNSLQTIRQ
jgi:hypothetical protein